MSKIRRVVSMLTVLVLILSLSITSLAVTSTQSAIKTATVYGHTYEYYSTIACSDTHLWGYVHAKAEAKVPAGYIGINTTLYNSNGALINSSGWRYNNAELLGMGISSGAIENPGTYRTKGSVKFYNGNDYYTYTVSSTPYLTFGSRSAANLSINSKGLTYGSDMEITSINMVPDLILAVGTNGVEGYVYSSDLYGENASLSEVKASLNEPLTNHYIPLYKEDGSTVVGMFEISREDVIVHNITTK